MINLDEKKGVIFDFGDTLASTIPTYPDRIRLSLLENGFSFTEDEFFDSYLYADYKVFTSYIDSGQISSRNHRNLLFSTLTEKLNIGKNSEEIFKMVKNNIKDIGYERITLNGAYDLLGLLKDKGYKLGIISNNDGRTEEKCEQVGIKDYFDIIVDSTKAGMVKPDANIFEKAARELNLNMSDLIHIGDLYGSDILGGLNAGMDVIWFNKRNAKNYEDLDIVTVKTHDEIGVIFK